MLVLLSVFFFFNDTATTEIYTLSLHDALPISQPRERHRALEAERLFPRRAELRLAPAVPGEEARPLRGREARSEEHTSELQSQSNLVCRLLLEKKNTTEVSSARHGEPAASDRV